MQRAFSIIMSFLFLLVISQQAVIIVNFKLNQQIITNQFCINKDKPELHCNGKCHLTKELKKSEHPDSKKIINTKNFDLTLNSNTAYHIEIVNISKNKNPVIYIEYHHTTPYLEVFVPPPIIDSNYNFA